MNSNLRSIYDQVGEELKGGKKGNDVPKQSCAELRNGFASDKTASLLAAGLAKMSKRDSAAAKQAGIRAPATSDSNMQTKKQTASNSPQGNGTSLKGMADELLADKVQRMSVGQERERPPSCFSDVRTV